MDNLIGYDLVIFRLHCISALCVYQTTRYANIHQNHQSAKSSSKSFPSSQKSAIVQDPPVGCISAISVASETRTPSALESALCCYVMPFIRCVCMDVFISYTFICPYVVMLVYTNVPTDIWSDVNKYVHVSEYVSTCLHT